MLSKCYKVFRKDIKLKTKNKQREYRKHRKTKNLFSRKIGRECILKPVFNKIKTIHEKCAKNNYGAPLGEKRNTLTRKKLIKGTLTQI